MTPIQETRTFASHIKFVAMAHQADKSQAVYAYQRILSDSDGNVIKAEEDIRVVISNDKVEATRAKSVDRTAGARPSNETPIKSEYADTGRYDDFNSTAPAFFEQEVLNSYVLPLFQ